MSTPHTPGPWHVNPASPHEVVAEAPHSEGHRLVVVADAVVAPNRDPGEEEFRANTRVLAAAPDLLAACKRAESYLARAIDYDHLEKDPRSELRQTLAEATAKAEERP